VIAAIVKGGCREGGLDAAASAGPPCTLAFTRKCFTAGVLRTRNVVTRLVAVIADVEVYPKEGAHLGTQVYRRPRLRTHHQPEVVAADDRGAMFVQGLSRTLFEEVHFDRNSVKSVDWASYPILEIRDAPEEIDIVLINSTDVAPSGAGEPTMRCVPPPRSRMRSGDATGVRMPAGCR